MWRADRLLLLLLPFLMAATPATALPKVNQTSDPLNPSCAAPAGAGSPLVPWPQVYLGASQAQRFSLGGGVLVGLVDTGVVPTGTLAGRLTMGPDVTGGGNAGKDCLGHGTFDAGLIAAAPQRGIGFVGLAPESGIYAVTATDPSGNTTADQLAAGIQSCVDNGARIVAVPMGVSTPSPALAAAVRYATAHDVLVVAPAMLDGQQQSGAVYPAQYPDVLSVADIGPTGAAPSSTVTGAKVDLAAPGDAVVSIGPNGAGLYTGSGPSYATALVAGAAALVLAYRPGIHRADLVNRLETTANPALGYGVLDPAAAITADLPVGAAQVPTAPAQQLRVAPPAPQADTMGGIAVAGGSFGLLAVLGFLAVVLPRGRRRHWRPGGTDPWRPTERRS